MSGPARGVIGLLRHPLPFGLTTLSRQGVADSQMVGTYQHGLWSIHTEDKILKATWSGCCPESRVPDGYTVTGSSLEQTFPVGFFPTAFVRDDGDLIYVAGRDNGGARLDTWLTRWPAIMPLPAADPTTSTLNCSTVGLTVARTACTYRAENGALGDIRRMVKMPGTERTLLVSFYPSAECRVLNVDTGQLSDPVLAPATNGNALVVPELLDFQDGLWFGDHTTRGHIFVFSWSGIRWTDDPSTVVVYDADRDGTLDGYELVAPDDWAGSEFADPNNYGASGSGVGGGRASWRAIGPTTAAWRRLVALKASVSTSALPGSAAWTETHARRPQALDEGQGPVAAPSQWPQITHTRS